MLAQADLRPHKTDMWIHSPDPQFREKATEICDLYLNPQPGSVVICIDEKIGMQAIERRFPDRPPAPSRRRRREFEYKRYGTQSLICGFEVHTGRAVARCGDTRTDDDLVRFMEDVACLYPDVVVHVIWDNLNIHYDGPDERWKAFNQRHGNRFVFHYTPKHAPGSTRSSASSASSSVSASPTPASVDGRTARYCAAIHRPLELRDGTSIPLDLHRIPPANWSRVGPRRMTGGTSR